MLCFFKNKKIFRPEYRCQWHTTGRLSPELTLRSFDTEFKSAEPKRFSSYFPSIKQSIKNYSADYSTHNSVKISQNGTNLMPRVPSMSSHFEMMTIFMSCMMTAFVLATEIEGQRLLRLLGPFGLFHLFVFSYETWILWDF